jgi:general stress protein 26
MNTQAKKDAVEFLMSQKVGVLSTTSNNQPQSSYIYYIADEDLSIYFATVVNSRKHDNLQVDDKVAFTVGTIKPPVTVQIEGIAEVVVDKDTIKAVTANYYDVAVENAHYPVPITKLDVRNGLVVYRIKPTWLRYSDFTDRNKVEKHGISVVLIWYLGCSYWKLINISRIDKKQ